jgi:hypothetical protein
VWVILGAGFAGLLAILAVAAFLSKPGGTHRG